MSKEKLIILWIVAVVIVFGGISFLVFGDNPVDCSNRVTLISDIDGCGYFCEPDLARGAGLWGGFGKGNAELKYRNTHKKELAEYEASNMYPPTFFRCISKLSSIF